MAIPATVRDELLRGLSDEARTIVTSNARRLLVVAGAGAGKTEAMARRIAWWHGHDGVPKDQIVAFTFTELAAEEMKFRIRKHLQTVEESGTDPSLGGMYVGTIHGFCLDLLRKVWPDEYHNDDVIDDVARYSLIQEGYNFLLGLPALEKARQQASGRQYSTRSETINYFLRAYDLLNEYDQLDVELADEPRPDIGAEQDWCKQARLRTRIGTGPVAEAFAASAARYYAFLRCRHFLDFSTAQSELTRRLRDDTEALDGLRASVTHLVVDEVQDINPVQDQIRRMFVDEQDGWLTAVGDHRQAIYGWRGGSIDIMARLAAELTNESDGEVLELTANYRSTPRIIDFSNRWNKTIDAPASMTSPDMTHGRAHRLDHDPHHIAVMDFDDRDAEASWIASAVTELVPTPELGAAHDTPGGERGLTYSDIAVLVRSSTDARTYMQALRDAGVPAVVKAGPDLFAQPEVLLYAAALSLSGGRDHFYGNEKRPTSLPGRLKTVLDVERGNQPHAAQRAIRAAFDVLAREGLPVEIGSPDKVIRAAEVMAARLRGEHPDRTTLGQLRTPELRTWLSGRKPVRRVFPQTMLQWLMSEGGVSAWDVPDNRAVAAMYHLGQLSSLITGIETPGWTRAGSYPHQISSLLLWGTEAARPQEAPLLAMPDAVTVTTVHSVKGLQYAAVFVADVCNLRFPSSRAKTRPSLPFNGDLTKIIDAALLADDDNNDDERRLMYVALTRAERFLFVTSSKPSKFFTELAGTINDIGGRTRSDSNTLRQGIPGLRRLPSERSREERLITSFSDLRYYLECPHDFYLRKVLGFTPTIDQAFGYGRGVHNLMRAVHTDPGRWADLAKDPPALRREVEQLIERGLFYLRHTTGEPAENMHRRGVEIVSDYVRTYVDELRNLTFEPERAFEVLVPGEEVLVSGAIDVVRLDSPPQVTIIDFKSGERDTDKNDALDEDEMRLQVSLYAVAAQHELEYEPERGLVRYLAEKDPTRRELNVPLDQQTITDSLTTVKSLAHGIQSRHFRSGPNKANKNGDHRCTTCDWTRICGLNGRTPTSARGGSQ